MTNPPSTRPGDEPARDEPPGAPRWNTDPSDLPLDAEPPTVVRYGVLAALCSMAFILYLDRICISQALTSIQKDLVLSDTAMGWVLGAFTIAYGLFEVPAGHMGDRYGSRKILTRIVWWWSAFTMLTGVSFGFSMLLAVRFLFGAGEAGALPNAARVISRWFPQKERGRAQGIMLTAALLGGALSPVISNRLLEAFGWRTSFLLLGIPGIVWGAWFLWWFRDNPTEHPSANEAERNYIEGPQSSKTVESESRHAADEHLELPVGRILACRNVWLLGGICSCCSFTTYLFFSWYSTYLQKARELSKGTAGDYSAIVLFAGALGSIFGGVLHDFVVRLTGERTWSRRLIAVSALSSAALAMIVSIHLNDPFLATLCAAWACFAVHVTLPCWWGVAGDISGPHLGAMFGLMNSMGVPGAFASQIFLGWMADWLQKLGFEGRDRWDPAFYVYGGLLVVGAICWLFVDPKRRIVDEPLGTT